MAAAAVSTADPKMEAMIIGLRPIASDTELATSSIGASIPVVSDSTRLLAAADTPNWSDRVGSIGCTQYNAAKVASPTANIARVVARNPAVPGSRKVGSPTRRGSAPINPHPFRMSPTPTCQASRYLP